MVARVMAIVLVLEMNGSANAKMDGVEKTVQRHKRPTAGMILTTIMVCIVFHLQVMHKFRYILMNLVN
jgi:hypothetical protein